MWDVPLDDMFGGNVSPEVAFMQGLVEKSHYQQTAIGETRLGRGNFTEYGKIGLMHNMITTGLQISEADKRARPNG